MENNIEDGYFQQFGTIVQNISDLLDQLNQLYSEMDYQINSDFYNALTSEFVSITSANPLVQINNGVQSLQEIAQSRSFFDKIIHPTKEY